VNIPQRPVRSYVLRQGRISSAQERALEELLPRYGIAFAGQRIDAARIFGRSAPLVLEIGSGMGETTVAIAQARPETDFIAIEVHGPGVGSLLKKIVELGLGNLRVVRHDAVEVLERMIPDGVLAGIHLFFPDPWPKKRHNKRRLVQPAFAALAARKLAPGGYFHAATDWEDYAELMLRVLSAEPLLKNSADSYAPRPAYRPLTKFEARGLKLGHPVRDLIFRRI
jgi:tRNA (guanine-N7-)-methyltransferase